MTAFEQRLAEAELKLVGGGSDEVERLSRTLSGTLERSSIDLHPHQIEAAAFALGALPLGGALLADEVGLGKTIEAGMVLAQLWSERKRRLLVITPASLQLQWVKELTTKFGLPTKRASGSDLAHDVLGKEEVIWITSHQLAVTRSDSLARYRWDLLTIDEAHHFRNAHRTGHRGGQALRHAFKNVPKLLLTATPMQNNLMELYGLCSLIEPSLLGEEEVFQTTYCNDQQQPAALHQDALGDLRARILPVVHRTLRRQVREAVRYTARRSMVEDFTPSKEEADLYRDVSEFLSRESLVSLPLRRRPLLTLVYRKILASSSAALASSFEKLAALVAPVTTGEAPPRLGTQWLTVGELKRLRHEVDELRSFAARARELSDDAKSRALCRGLDRAFTLARASRWPEKAVVFTGFLATQRHLEALLGSRGYRVATVSGKVASPEERQRRIEHFRTEGQVLLLTEAGAEGLNLQFCNLVVNYDLPWNPQRVEQRIGRCHRYGQQRDVLVVNFLNRSNAADSRLYELLSQKLALFDGVFGASDEVLGAIGNGVDFEARIGEIYRSCRSTEEIDRAFAELQSNLLPQLDARLMAARGLLFERFDEEVRSRLRLTSNSVQQAMKQHKKLEAMAVTTASSGPNLNPPNDGASSHDLDRLSVQSRHLPAALATLQGRAGFWFVYRLSAEASTLEERLLHLVLVWEVDHYRLLNPNLSALFRELPFETTAEANGQIGSVAQALADALEAARREATADRQQRVRRVEQLKRLWALRCDDESLERLRGLEVEARTTRNASRRRAIEALTQGVLTEQNILLFTEADNAYERSLSQLRGEESRLLQSRLETAQVPEVPLDRRSRVAAALWQIK